MFNSVSTCALAARGLCSVAAAEPCLAWGSLAPADLALRVPVAKQGFSCHLNLRCFL